MSITFFVTFREKIKGQLQKNRIEKKMQITERVIIAIKLASADKNIEKIKHFHWTGLRKHKIL